MRFWSLGFGVMEVRVIVWDSAFCLEFRDVVLAV